MEKWGQDKRRDVVLVDIDQLVPADHMLRKIEKIMDYEWLYERLNPYYCHDNGRPGTDPVVLIKMVLVQHLYGIPSLRQTQERVNDTVSYRWFLGYSLLDKIPHFATVSYAFCQRFPAELPAEIFAHILNKAINNHAVEPGAVFIDGTHIKASANKKKFQKEQVARAAKVYEEELRKEVNEEREKLGKAPIEEDNGNDETPGGGTVEKTASTTDPECGMFVKGEHERQFAYEAHTACDKNGMILAVEVTAGNVNDSAAWDAVYDAVTERFPEATHIVMDAGYKTPWITKKILEDSRIPVLPYTRSKTAKGHFQPWDYKYDEITDTLTCPEGKILRHTTTDRAGKRIYRSTPSECRGCPKREKCGARGNGQKMIQRHIWAEHLELAEELRKTRYGKRLYALRKESIERVFADAKEKHGMRYTTHRGLARVTQWVTLKFACMNLKKLANWWGDSPDFSDVFAFFFHFQYRNMVLA